MAQVLPGSLQLNRAIHFIRSFSAIKIVKICSKTSNLPHLVKFATEEKPHTTFIIVEQYKNVCVIFLTTFGLLFNLSPNVHTLGDQPPGLTETLSECWVKCNMSF